MVTRESELTIYDQIQDWKSYTIFADFFNLYTNGRGFKSDEQLARLLEVTPAAVCQWKNGLRVPRPKMIYHFREKLRLTRGEVQNLLFARSVQLAINDMIEYVEAGMKEGHGQIAMKVAKPLIGQMLNDLGCDEKDYV